MSGLHSVIIVVWTYPFFVRYLLSTIFLLKIINFKKYSLGCGNFSGFVYKETESQEIVWIFTR